MKLADFETLAEAKAYETTQGRMVSRHIMNGILAQASLYVPLKRMADDDTNPFQNAMAAFFDSGISDYNFQTAHPIGQQNLGMLDDMIAADVGGLGSALAAVKTQLLALANVTVTPFADTTEHAWQLAKGTVQRVEKTPTNGYLQITTTADCERHNPQISIQVGSEFVRVASFNGIESAGTYTAQVPKGYSTLWVDDTYGVI